MLPAAGKAGLKMFRGFSEQVTRVLADLKIFRKPLSVVLLVEPLGIQGAPHLQDLEVSFQFLRHLRGLHIEPAISCGLLLLHLSRKTTSPLCTGRHAQPRRCDPETHSALQLHLLLGFAVRRHRVLLLKVCSDYTPLHHLSATDKRLTAEALKAKQKPHLRCCWADPSLHTRRPHSFRFTVFR